MKPLNLHGPPTCTGNGKSLALATRFSTSPKAPSAPCCNSSTTLRVKNPSSSVGRAIRKEPAKDDMARLAKFVWHHCTQKPFLRNTKQPINPKSETRYRTETIKHGWGSGF